MPICKNPSCVTVHTHTRQQTSERRTYDSICLVIYAKTSLKFRTLLTTVHTQRMPLSHSPLQYPFFPLFHSSLLAIFQLSHSTLHSCFFHLLSISFFSSFIFQLHKVNFLQTSIPIHYKSFIHYFSFLDYFIIMCYFNHSFAFFYIHYYSF